MAIDRANLEIFYGQTLYTVLLPRKPLTFRIGHYDPSLDKLLQEHCGVTREWVIITPYNPNSVVDDDANHASLARMRRELETESLKHFKSVNQSPEGEWHELGFLIVDADPTRIKIMARRYRQNAFVSAKLGQAPKLVWMV